jgi:hypothetical protein
MSEKRMAVADFFLPGNPCERRVVKKAKRWRQPIWSCQSCRILSKSKTCPVVASTACRR